MKDILRKISQIEHNVELASLGELANYIKESANQDKMYSEVTKKYDELDAIKQRLIAEIKDKKSALQKLQDDGFKYATDFSQKLKELGLDAKNIKEYNDADKAWKLNDKIITNLDYILTQLGSKGL